MISFDPGLIIWTTIIFTLLLIVLKKFAWKPILNSVDERNKSIEEALKAANNNDLSPLKKLIKVLETPYEKLQENIDYQSPSPIGTKKYQTFCGT